MHNGRDIKRDERLIDVRLKADSEVAPCPDQRKPLGSADSACLTVLKASYGWTLNMPFGMALAVACRAAQREAGRADLRRDEGANLSAGLLIRSLRGPISHQSIYSPACIVSLAPSVLQPSQARYRHIADRSLEHRGMYTLPSAGLVDICDYTTSVPRHSGLLPPPEPCMAKKKQ
ncbi:hypothetical protein K491DRAFT_283628 [Lophiostoma macrostomum CBS 122681]|uniref:Uncharacterized protein n=1 Tax=Lophiostoma macrostomum CBS 122681 TaxID=1314788 RepID=A0A6A6TSE0_9PLEO|nr:hypothetical protein K491DRAFT_283628 [Lophiostoma macrostomum CBS 122681]